MPEARIALVPTTPPSAEPPSPDKDRVGFLEWTTLMLIERWGWNRTQVARAIGYKESSGIRNIVRGDSAMSDERCVRLVELADLVNKHPKKLRGPTEPLPLDGPLLDLLQSPRKQARPAPTPAHVQTPTPKPDAPTEDLLHFLQGVQAELDRLARKVQARAECVLPWQAPGLLEGARRVRALRTFFDHG